MHYRVCGKIIKSELAAKSVKQQAKHVTQYLRNLQDVDKGADYGCGRLRYSDELRMHCNHLTLIDSQQQLSRHQIIHGRFSTIYDFVKTTWKNVDILTIEEFEKNLSKFDFILCANVLSAIPNPHRMLRALQCIHSKLKKSGEALFVTQYTNSYFTQMRDNKKAFPHSNGWIVDSVHGTFYYGILRKSEIQKMLQENGFTIHKAWTEGQSAMVLAGKRSSIKTKWKERNLKL